MTTNTKEIVDNTVGGALSTMIANIALQLQEVARGIEDRDEASKFIKAVVAHEDCLPRNTIKDIVVDLAVKHKVSVCLGNYGNGESLQLEDDSWYGVSAGDWVSSSATC
jgi:hypothetical protein